MDRNHFAHASGDTINTVLAAASVIHATSFSLDTSVPFAIAVRNAFGWAALVPASRGAAVSHAYTTRVGSTPYRASGSEKQRRGMHYRKSDPHKRMQPNDLLLLCQCGHTKTRPHLSDRTDCPSKSGKSLCYVAQVSAPHP
jgi:hypothetical protein